MNEKLKEFGYISKNLFEQIRNLNPENLNVFSKSLKDYLLKLKQEGKSEFEILEKQQEWIYRVWAKKIYLNTEK